MNKCNLYIYNSKTGKSKICGEPGVFYYMSLFDSEYLFSSCQAHKEKALAEHLFPARFKEISKTEYLLIKIT